MSVLDPLIKQPVEWLRGRGTDSEIVISSRIRLARNVAEYPFARKLSEAQQKDIIKHVGAAVKSSAFMKSSLFVPFDEIENVDKEFLLERHLISREHATEEGEKAVAISTNEVVSLMVLEEDHLRLQGFQSGFNLLEAWKIVSKIDDELEDKLSYSFSADYGYLTACPTNVGTGLRASCMLHLPGLVLTKQVQKVLQALSKLNVAVRGLYGEGTQATGNLFQFSNQLTLGMNEDEIIDNLECVIRQVVEHERKARGYLKANKKAKYDDEIWRAIGTLKAARVISSQEATKLISLLQLAVHQGMVGTGLSLEDLNALFLLVQPAHLQKVMGKELGINERDATRADLIRDKLKNVTI